MLSCTSPSSPQIFYIRADRKVLASSSRPGFICHSGFCTCHLVVLIASLLHMAAMCIAWPACRRRRNALHGAARSARLLLHI